MNNQQNHQNVESTKYNLIDLSQPPKLKQNVSPFTSVATFPGCVRFVDQDPDEYMLLFVRQAKIILIIDLLINLIVPLAPFLILLAIKGLNIVGQNINIIIKTEVLTASKWWLVFIVFMLSYGLISYFNIFFKWFYNINIVTNKRFVDLDYQTIFNVGVETTALQDIQDVKNRQTGVFQTIFGLGDVEVLTASGKTTFSLPNVYQAHKIRDFIQDVILAVKEKISKN
ncbi:MAG: PH domain-containing protein [Candidatus Dojkabacteria bacterium]|nr:PH domain-containing protein [Candidatus Dojkabacteria bacterium]